MSTVETMSVPKRDRALSVMQARKNEALMGVVIAFAGLLIALGMLVADIWYSAEPAMKITNEYFAWALALVTTPLEFAGIYLLTRPEQRKDLETAMLWFLWVTVPASLVYDIITNCWGLYNEAMAMGSPNSDLAMAFALGVGVALAGIEYLVVAFLRVLAAKRADLTIASEWLCEYERAREGETAGQSAPSRRSVRPHSGGW